jgi:hypothetical protein
MSLSAYLKTLEVQMALEPNTFTIARTEKRRAVKYTKQSWRSARLWFELLLCDFGGTISTRTAPASSCNLQVGTSKAPLDKCHKAMYAFVFTCGCRVHICRRLVLTHPYSMGSEKPLLHILRGVQASPGMMCRYLAARRAIRLVPEISPGHRDRQRKSATLRADYDVCPISSPS